MKVIGNIYQSGHEAGNIYDTDGECPTLKCNGPRANLKKAAPMIQVKSATKDGFEIASEGDSINLSMPNSKTRRGRVGVAQTLDTQSNQSVLLAGNIRRLTEIECERLQGYKDNHTEFGLYPTKKVTQKQMNKMRNDELIALFEGEGEMLIKRKIPKGQRYKLCGNAVTTDIVELIGVKLNG